MYRSIIEKMNNNFIVIFFCRYAPINTYWFAYIVYILTGYNIYKMMESDGSIIAIMYRSTYSDYIYKKCRLAAVL